METVKKAADITPDFTLTVSKGRNTDEKFVVGLKDIDEQTFLAAYKLIKNDKEIEATKFLIRQLRVSGDPAEEVCANFHAVRAAQEPLMEMVRPLEGELKKN